MERFFFAKLEIWLVLLLLVFGVGAGVVWSYAVLQNQVFPYRQVDEFRNAIKGVPGDMRPLNIRLRGLFVYQPDEFVATRQTEVLPEDAFTAVSATPDAPDPLPVLDGLKVANPGGERRYFLVFGSFVFPERRENRGVIALDSEGMIHRAWPAMVEGGEFPGMHIGLAISENGVVATNTQGILSAQSWCGEKLWQAPWTPPSDGIRRDYNGPDGYDWHHDIVYHDGLFHTFVGVRIARVNAETGVVEQEISGIDLMHWSWRDGLALLDARNDFFNADRLTEVTAGEMLVQDPFHFNKVDVLSEALAPDYPMFEPGDLLITARDLNLVFVLRPDEERIVWWRYGLASRPHDATFVEGAVELFNNAPFSSPRRPTIRRLSVDLHNYEDLLDLSQWEMVMGQKGNFERRGDRILTVDDEAGRMIAGRTSGEIDFVFENGYENDAGGVRNLQLRNATELSAADFARFEAQCAG